MEARIEKIVHGGYGLARLEGRSCLVPFALPGETLDIECGRDGPVCFGWIRRVVEASPRRRESACPVFGVCGGCDFDHMDYPLELEVKSRILVEDLARLGGTEAPPLGPTAASREYGYRNHAQFKVSLSGVPGFFAKKSHEVVPLPPEGCLLLDESINGFVRTVARGSPLRPGGFRVRTDGEGRVFKKGVPGVHDDPFFDYRVGGTRMRLRIDDFFQVNRFLVGKWVEAIEELLEPEPGDGVADIFCGSGIVGLRLANGVGTVVGIEMNGSAVESARRNARSNGVDNVSFVRADAAKGLRGLGSELRINKVVVDPPRSGLSRELVASIAALEPSIVAYASCDTATFSRDVGLFSASGYSLSKLSIVDMFPRTRHLELVAALVRARPSGRRVQSGGLAGGHAGGKTGGS